MLKVHKVLTKEDLLKRNFDFEEKVAKLEMQIKMLKEMIMDKGFQSPAPPAIWWVNPFQYVNPWMPDSNKTGDPLPIDPVNVCGVN